MNLTTPPPEKLSALSRLALADARKLDRARYTRGVDDVAPAPPARREVHGVPRRRRHRPARWAVRPGPPSTSPRARAPTRSRPRSPTSGGAARSGRSTPPAKATGRGLPRLHGTHPDGELYDALEALPDPADPEFSDWTSSTPISRRSPSGRTSYASSTCKLTPTDHRKEKPPMTTTTNAAAAARATRRSACATSPTSTGSTA